VDDMSMKGGTMYGRVGWHSQYTGDQQAPLRQRSPPAGSKPPWHKPVALFSAAAPPNETPGSCHVKRGGKRLPRGSSSPP
jgi:hypothetical protein